MRVLMAVLTILLLPAFAGAQSLGSAARKEAQRRKQAPKDGAKVYGNEDLSTREDAPVEAAPEPGSTSDTEAVTTRDGVAVPSSAPSAEDAARQQLEREERERTRKEAYWRQRAQNARTRVTQAQSNYDFVCAGGVLLTGG
jgi:hypothetical protein